MNDNDNDKISKLKKEKAMIEANIRAMIENLQKKYNVVVFEIDFCNSKLYIKNDCTQSDIIVKLNVKIE